MRGDVVSHDNTGSAFPSSTINPNPDVVDFLAGCIVLGRLLSRTSEAAIARANEIEDGHHSRRLHTAGVLRGFARRPRPRYADDAQWTSAVIPKQLGTS